MVSDESFDCGDIYITVSSIRTGDIVTQEGYFDQCFAELGATIPVGSVFSVMVDTPGTFEIMAQMISPELDTITAAETFTVK